jgi:hypothetical protein
VAELGWAKDAEDLYLDLQADPGKLHEREAVDQILDAIEDDPDSANVRKIGLTAADGRRVWKVTNRFRNSDLMAVLWDIRDDQPIINWIGPADYGM